MILRCYVERSTQHMEDGAYSLADLELAIASKFTEAQVSSVSGLMPSFEGDPYYADSEGFIDGSTEAPQAIFVYGKVQVETAIRKLHLVDASPEARTRWDIALSIDEAIEFTDVRSNIGVGITASVFLSSY
jgi:hypothetical protein